MNQKHKLRSLGSRWFNCHLCLFRIECRVVLLLDSHCIKDSGECNKDWITNNQYWWNWKKKIGFGWIMRTGETGETTWSKEENPTTNSTHIWRRRCGIWTRHCWKAIACVASVSSRGSSRKLGQEQKKNEWRGRGRGKKEPLLPSPSPFNLFFASALPFAQ